MNLLSNTALSDCRKNELWRLNGIKTKLKPICENIKFRLKKPKLDDPLALTVNDESHSFDEKRFITVGESKIGRLILVSHTIGKENVRIISARKPTRGEREDYEHG